MKRKASAVWTGSLQEGQGSLSTTSGVLQETPYSFNTRFAEGKGTNPEELIAAAHAGCFSMALSGFLSKAGFEPQKIETSATLTLDKVDDNWTITASHLIVQAEIDGIDETKFIAIAEDAKKNCPVSRLMKAELTLEARLATKMAPKNLEMSAPELQI